MLKTFQKDRLSIWVDWDSIAVGLVNRWSLGHLNIAAGCNGSWNFVICWRFVKRTQQIENVLPLHVGGNRKSLAFHTSVWWLASGNVDDKHPNHSPNYQPAKQNRKSNSKRQVSSHSWQFWDSVSEVSICEICFFSLHDVYFFSIPILRKTQCCRPCTLLSFMVLREHSE